jgi:hypothetical protein
MEERTCDGDLVQFIIDYLIYFSPLLHSDELIVDVHHVAIVVWPVFALTGWS